MRLISLKFLILQNIVLNIALQ